MQKPEAGVVPALLQGADGPVAPVAQTLRTTRAFRPLESTRREDLPGERLSPGTFSQHQAVDGDGAFLSSPHRPGALRRNAGGGGRGRSVGIR